MGCSKSSSKREVYSDNNPTSRNNNKKYQIDNLTLHLKQLENEEQKNPKIGRRKEIVNILAEINEKEMETVVKINKTKSWFFEKINKIDKRLARLIKKKERRIKSTKLEMKKERLQQTMQKYKGLQETIMNNYLAIKWITWKKWTNSKKSSIFQD